MDHDKEQPQTFQDLTGRILVAEATLRHPTFHRTVIYLARHTSEGAHGYVINRPMEQKLPELLSGDEFHGLADVPVFQGGPVADARLSFAIIEWDARASVIRFDSHLSTADATAAVANGRDVRAFVGYSGWSPGQLEREIDEHSWMVFKPGAGIAGRARIDELWTTVLRSMGAYYKLISLTPDFPEHN